MSTALRQAKKTKSGQRQSKTSGCKQTSLHSFPCRQLQTHTPPSPSLPACAAIVRRPVGRGPGSPPSPGTPAMQCQERTGWALGLTGHIPSAAPSPPAEEGHKSNTVCPYKLCFACVQGAGTAVRTARRVPGSRCVSWL